MLNAIARSYILNARNVEIVVRLDLVIAEAAHHGVVIKRAEAFGFVIFLKVHQFTRIAPPLFVLGIVTVLNEAQGNATVLDKMPTHGSNSRASVMLAFDFWCVTHWRGP